MFSRVTLASACGPNSTATYRPAPRNHCFSNDNQLGHMPVTSQHRPGYVCDCYGTACSTWLIENSSLASLTSNSRNPESSRSCRKGTEITSLRLPRSPGPCSRGSTCRGCPARRWRWPRRSRIACRRTSPPSSTKGAIVIWGLERAGALIEFTSATSDNWTATSAGNFRLGRSVPRLTLRGPARSQREAGDRCSRRAPATVPIIAPRFGCIGQNMRDYGHFPAPGMCPRRTDAGSSAGSPQVVPRPIGQCRTISQSFPTGGALESDRDKTRPPRARANWGQWFDISSSSRSSTTDPCPLSSTVRLLSGGGPPEPRSAAPAGDVRWFQSPPTRRPEADRTILPARAQ